MNPRLFQMAIDQAFVADLFGVIGLGLVALAAVRLARIHAGANAHLMTLGAVALLLGRLSVLFHGPLMSAVGHLGLGRGGLAVAANLPVMLLTLGLGAVVLGFWFHERHGEEPENASRA